MATTPWRLARWTSIFLFVPTLIACTTIAQFSDAPFRELATASPLPSVIAIAAATQTPTPSPVPVRTTVNLSTTISTRVQTANRAQVCREGDPLANVWGPTRLTVVTRCLTVIGVVASVITQVDGDWEIALLVDSPYLGLLNQHNVGELSGTLRVEVVPADQPGCTVGKPPKNPKGGNFPGVCTGANVAKPNLGAHVQVIGPYVTDTNGGWMEIHPVWGIVLLAGGPTVGPAVAPIATRLAHLTDADEGAYLDTPTPTP